MLDADVAVISGLIRENEAELLSSWLRSQLDAGSLRSGQLKEDELKQQSRQFLREFVRALKSAKLDDINTDEWEATRDLLGDFSRSHRASVALSTAGKVSTNSVCRPIPRACPCS